MTRVGGNKPADRGMAEGRLRKARAYHEAARVLLDALDHLPDADPVISCATLAAIAYTDAVTAAVAGRINQGDHGGAVKLLREALGNELPTVQRGRLERVLGRKDEVQYGARPGRTAEARLAVENLDGFAAWTVEVLRKRGLG